MTLALTIAVERRRRRYPVTRLSSFEASRLPFLNPRLCTADGTEPSHQADASPHQSILHRHRSRGQGQDNFHMTDWAVGMIGVSIPASIDILA